MYLFMYTASVIFDYYCRDSQLSYIGGIGFQSTPPLEGAGVLTCLRVTLPMAVATTEVDEAVASSVFFVQIMGIPFKKLLVRVILVIFGHFASSDFKVWLRSCSPEHGTSIYSMNRTAC